MFDTWIVLGKDDCPWCDRVKHLIEDEAPGNILIDYTNVSKIPHLMTLMSMAGMTTVPQVFLNDQYIGGYQAVEELLHDGRT